MVETNKRPSSSDSVFNIYQYHEVFSSAIANALTLLIQAQTSKNERDIKEANAVLLVLYLWARASNNNPISEKEYYSLSYLDHFELIQKVVPELKKAGIAPVQASFGESYYSRVISKIQDVEDLLIFLKLKEKDPQVFEKLKQYAEK